MCVQFMKVMLLAESMNKLKAFPLLYTFKGGDGAVVQFFIWGIGIY